jgi:hypothetical protein
MSFSTISTFSSLKFSSSGVNIIYTFPDVDSSMSVYYTFNFAANNSIPNYFNIRDGKTIYDATIIGYGNINNTLPNYVVGTGALQVVNDISIATQYVQNIIPINTTTNNNCLSVSIWFNPSSISSGFSTLFDIIGNIGFKGIQIDLSGTNTICYGYYDAFISNLFFNVDASMSFYYPLCSATDNILPNYYNASNNSVIYDANMVGGASISSNISVMGNASLQLSNSVNTNASQYVRNNTKISTTEFSGITISVWFNASNLYDNNMYTIFDIGGTDGAIQLDLSGTNEICSQLYW